VVTQLKPRQVLFFFDDTAVVLIQVFIS